MPEDALTAEAFKAQLTWLITHGYHFISVDQVLRGHCGQGRLPAHAGLTGVGGAGGITALRGRPAEYGCYPERLCADRIYINKKDRNFCTRNNIPLSDKRFGRPSKDPEISVAHKQQLSADQRKRNEVEGCFGSGKRKSSLDLIMARLPKGAETSISMKLVVMCAEKIRRLLRLFVVIIDVWFYAFQKTGWLWMGLRDFWWLEKGDLLLPA